MENYHISLAHLKLDSCVVSAAKYTRQDGAALSADVLFPALRTLVETHAALGLQIEGNEATSRVFFVRLPSVDLARVVEFSGRGSVQEAFARHLARQFATQGALPLWRVEVLAENVVVFAVHHAVGDGLSSTAFHLSLFRALQEDAHRDAAPVVHVPTTLALLPPIEGRTNVRPSLRTLYREAAASLLPVSWRKLGSAWSGRPVPSSPTFAAHVRLLSLPAAEVAPVLAACRAHHASLTAAVYDLSISLLSRMLASDPARYKYISALVAIALRSAAGVGPEAICDYPSSWQFFAPVRAAFSWAEAARTARTLQGLKTRARERVGMLRFLFGRVGPYHESRIGAKRECAFSLSNVGRVEAPVAAGAWSVGEIFFAQSDAGVGPAFTINVVGDPTGGLNISFAWGESNIEEEFIESFISQFPEAFRAIVSA